MKKLLIIGFCGLAALGATYIPSMYSPVQINRTNYTMTIPTNFFIANSNAIATAATAGGVVGTGGGSSNISDSGYTLVISSNASVGGVIEGTNAAAADKVLKTDGTRMYWADDATASPSSGIDGTNDPLSGVILYGANSLHSSATMVGSGAGFSNVNAQYLYGGARITNVATYYDIGYPQWGYGAYSFNVFGGGMSVFERNTNESGGLHLESTYGPAAGNDGPFIYATATNISAGTEPFDASGNLVFQAALASNAKIVFMGELMDTGLPIPKTWFTREGDWGYGTNTPRTRVHIVGGLLVDGNQTNTGTAYGLFVGGGSGLTNLNLVDATNYVNAVTNDNTFWRTNKSQLIYVSNQFAGPVVFAGAVHGTNGAGSPGQVWTTDGTKPYWATVAGSGDVLAAGVNNFANSNYFGSNTTFGLGIRGTNGLGAAGQVWTTDGAVNYWSTPTGGSGGGPSMDSVRSNYVWFEDFIGKLGSTGTGQGLGLYANHSSGAVGQRAGSSNRVGVLYLGTATSASSYATVYNAIDAYPILLSSQAVYTNEWTVCLPTLATYAEGFKVRLGLFNKTDATVASDGVYAYYDTNATQLVLVATKDSSETRVTNSTALAAGTWYTIRFVIQGSTNATMTVNDTDAVSVTNNLPGAGDGLAIEAQINKVNGTTARTLELDWMTFGYTITR